MSRLLFTLGLLVSILTFTNAQSLASEEENTNLYKFEIEQFESNSWVFQSIENDKTYFIDFEALGGQVADISIVDENGVELLSENLFDTPSDAIYEVDFADFGKGSYDIRIRTYQSEYHKTINIAK